MREEYDIGKRRFSVLFTRWMDGNEWSHPVMVQLATACLQNKSGKGWLHSSQISGLRHGKLESPGPRTFVAIERLNTYLFEYKQTGKSLPGGVSQDHYKYAQPITERGKVPSLGWFFEVFCGVVTPSDYDLDTRLISDMEAGRYSAEMGKSIRRSLIESKVDIITDLDRIVRDLYPVREESRVSKLISVIKGQGQWTGEELQLEEAALQKMMERFEIQGEEPKSPF